MKIIEYKNERDFVSSLAYFCRIIDNFLLFLFLSLLLNTSYSLKEVIKKGTDVEKDIWDDNSYFRK